MSCREHAREIHKTPQCYAEIVTATGAETDDFLSRTFDMTGFNCALLYVNLPPGDSPGDNVPLSIKAWAVSDPEDVEGTKQLILEKCLNGAVDWSGHAFLEVNETHIGRYLDYSDSGDYPYLTFSIEGPDGTDYEMIVCQGCPEFESPENVLELFSATTTTTTAAPTTTTTGG